MAQGRNDLSTLPLIKRPPLLATDQFHARRVCHSNCTMLGEHLPNATSDWHFLNQRPDFPGPVVQWLVQRFRSERLRVRSRRSVTFTPSAHVRRQSLPVWPPTLNNYLYLYLYQKQGKALLRPHIYCQNSRHSASLRENHRMRPTLAPD